MSSMVALVHLEKNSAELCTTGHETAQLAARTHARTCVYCPTSRNDSDSGGLSHAAVMTLAALWKLNPSKLSLLQPMIL